LGYADVLAVGSATPCFFVGKADVESWPFIGSLFRVSLNIGVPRSTVKSLVDVNASIARRLANGQSACVFLEGTSTGGDRLLPFYSPLVQPSLEVACPVVPVGLKWSAEDSEVDVAEDIAYWKDHTFAPHAWRLLGLQGVRCDVTFGEAIMTTDHTRKTLAAAVQKEVSRLTGLG
jgi:1-acyl-sn-glycerol-3-phosphate acyltransferase